MKRTTIVPISKKRRAALPERAKVRQVVLERDGYECQFWTKAPVDAMDWPNVPFACDRSQLDVHEIIPRSAWKDGWLVPENCVCLCRRHHEFVTDNPDLAHSIGLHGYSWERPDNPGEGM